MILPTLRALRCSQTAVGTRLIRKNNFNTRQANNLGKCYFHSTPRWSKIQPYLLADIGEGITECRIVQWLVKPGDRVRQFDPVCEVQSDKASVEITSRYDGIIKDIHHEVDDMATVGKSLLDIDVEDSPADQVEATSPAPAAPEIDAHDTRSEGTESVAAPTASEADQTMREASTSEPQSIAQKSGIASPAVRRILKEYDINIHDVQGNGKEGRVLKEDIQRYLASIESPSSPSSSHAVERADKITPLSIIESQMFRVMADALSIPHFGYAHSVDFTSLNNLRRTFSTKNRASIPKVSPLPIILKALSTAFMQHPKLNAHLDLQTDSQKPQLVVKGSHDFGIAVDTPNGLLVPVVRGVQNHSILSLASEIKRLSTLAKDGRLAPSNMKGPTFTVSNIGSIGGSVVHPVIVPPMVAIVGVGKVEDVPVFVKNERGEEQVVKREKTTLSWSADHRVLDGASVAKCAEAVGERIEDIGELGFMLR